MIKGLKEKFQINNMKELLLSTNKKIIVENAPSDYTWGCGKKGTGKN